MDELNQDNYWESINKLINDNEELIKEKIENKTDINKEEINKKIFKTKKEKKLKKEILDNSINPSCKRNYYDKVWVDNTLDDWNNDDFRIYVSNLGNEITDNHLICAFRKYKSFLKAKVIKDNKTKLNKGYGFVSIGNQTDYISAMKEMDGKYIGKKPIKLKKSNWKNRSLNTNYN